MTARPRRGAPPAVAVRALLALVAALTTLALTVLAVPTAPRAAADEETDGGVGVTLASLSPSVARPGDTLTVTARVRNDGEETLEGLTVTLGIGWRVLTARSQLTSWAEAPVTDRPAPAAVPAETVARLAPGATTDVTFTTAVDDLQLGTTSPWGPRQLSVSVAEGGSRVAVLRSFFLWDPRETAEDGTAADGADVALSVVAPLTGPAVDTADPTASAAALAASTGPDEHLGSLLDATVERPEISWAVDPAVVASAAGSDDLQVRAWADAVVAAGADRDVYTLPAYDPDLAALAHASLTPDGVVAATSAPLPDGWTAPASWRGGLAWPADGAAPDVATLGAAVTAGRTHTVVGGGGLEPEGATTPSGLATVSTPAGDTTAVVADDPLSDAFADGSALGSAVPVAQAGQRLLAETAVVARDGATTADGAADRRLVVALPRTWTPDDATLGATMDLLAGSGWVRFAPLHELLDGPVPDASREPLAASEVQGAELSAAAVHELELARTATAAFATATSDPAALTSSVAPDLVAPLAVAYRSAPDARAAAVAHGVSAAQTLRQGVSVVPGSSINLVATSGDLPVRVRNELATDVTVTVVLRPDDPRLKIEEQPVVTVRAGGEQEVAVPSKAIGSGNVDVRVELLGPSGAPVAEPSTFQVRVRAGWETVGTVVVGVLLGLGLVLGLVRTVRRGRSPRRDPGADVDAPPTQPTPTPTGTRS